MSKTKTGTIRTVKHDAGYGFIRPAGGSGTPSNPDFFFHRTGMGEGQAFDDLSEGHEVTFVEEPSPKGPRATQITRS